VQFSRAYLEEIAPFVPKDVPIISTSKVRCGLDFKFNGLIGIEDNPQTHRSNPHPPTCMSFS